MNEFREVYEIAYSTGSVRGYFSSFWNVLDWGVCGLSFAALYWRVQFYSSPSVRNFSPFLESYVELSDVADYYNTSFEIDSIAAFFCILRFFRYFELQRNLFVLRSSIERGLADLFVFVSLSHYTHFPHVSHFLFVPICHTCQ